MIDNIFNIPWFISRKTVFKLGSESSLTLVLKLTLTKTTLKVFKYHVGYSTDVI